MMVDRVAMRGPHRQRQRDEREDRKEMDRAPRPPQAQLMNPERARADDHHQGDPDPPDRAVRQGALLDGELHEAEHKRRRRHEGMKLNCRCGIEQGREAH